jgi:hypothetical protein
VFQKERRPLGLRRSKPIIDIGNGGAKTKVVTTSIPTPEPWVRAISDLRLPSIADQRLQALMDRNNDGLLLPDEKEELAAFAAWSEEVSLLRAEAFQLLGLRPA